MDKAIDNGPRRTKRALEEILKNRKKAKKPKMVVAVSNEDNIEDFFTWEEYLMKCRAKAVPKSAFKHVPLSDSRTSGFKTGMKVEAKDSSSTCNSYWVATVVMASGPLLLLRFDGYDNDRSGDFWLNASSQLLQPIGWCAKTHNLLIPPEAIRHKEKNWAKYLINNLKNAIAAPDNLFHKSVEQENKNLKIGAKLEVQDKENPLCYWVASVVEIFGQRLRLRFEGYESEDGDIWEYLLSDRLHNLGWSKQMKMMLIPPKVMEKYSNWAVFRRVAEMCLSHSGTEKEASLPVNRGFKPGMKLEAVNPENPILICAATVKDILNNYFFTVEIDLAVTSAETSPLKFVCHSKSKYIFPVGWCEKNNVKLTPPKGYSFNSFKWKSYLDSTNAEAAPESLFDKDLVKQKPISLSDLNQIKLGLFMEVLDQDDPSYFWVGKVVRSVGFRLIVHLEGDSNLNNIEVHYLSESVHHLGWGFQAGLQLKPPKAMKSEWLDEIQLLNMLYKLRKADPNSSLKLKKEDSLPDIHGFKEGMQLEAVNPQDPSSICVASVKKIINEYYFTVQIDSLINTIKDKNIVFWCHAKSRNIFPVGWCDHNKLQLTPPPGYSNKEFRWDAYVESLQTKAAPQSLFCQDVPSNEFQITLKLEAVDQTKPETISVATVSQVVGRTIWVRLDGYPSNAVEHIYDMESYDLLPVGWCGTHGHPLLTPHQKKKEPQTRRWVASLRKRSTDSRVSTTTDSKRKRRRAESSLTKEKKLQKSAEKRKSLDKNPKESRRVTSTVSASQQTPSSSTTDESARQSEEIVDVVDRAESDIDTTSESGQRPTTTIDLTNDNDLNGQPDHVRLFFKKSCSSGPYVDRTKLYLVPDIIGPATPNTILRKVVEYLVRCSNSAEKVLQLLSSEREKKSFLSILKTIVSKLSLCENLFSLHLVEECASCGKAVIQSNDPSSQKTNSSTTTDPSSPIMLLPNSTTKQITPKEQNPNQKPIMKTLTPVDLTHPNSTTKQITTKEQTPKHQPIKKTPPPSIDVTQPNSTTKQTTPIEQTPRHYLRQKTPPQSIDVTQPNSTTKQTTPIEQTPRHYLRQKTPPPSIDVIQPNSTLKQTTPKEQTPKHQLRKKTPPPSIDVIQPNSTTKQTTPTEQTPRHYLRKKTPPPSIDVIQPNSTTKQTTPKEQTPRHQLRKKTPPPSSNDHQSTSICIDDDEEDDVIGKIPEGNICTWSTADVVEFITPRDCKKFANVFLEQEVDGKALMLLSLDDIHKVLGVTLGPAIKLHDDVQKLRRRSR